jgi:2,6-dihydroxypseudooxynicotine hydrolase
MSTTPELPMEHRIPRLVVSGVDYNDVRTILGRVEREGDWPGAWESMAQMHEGLGDEALRLGRHVTAGQALVRAAIYYHFGAAGNVHDAAEKGRLQSRQRAAYRKAAPHLDPPAEIIEIAFDGILFPANLRLPRGGPRPAPCVLLNPGSDSTKEEFHTLENAFLERGLATCSFDGPGQSLTWQQMKLRPDFEKPVGAVIDALQRRGDIDGGRIGIWGRSFGGYAAPRAASLEPRLAACVSAGGFYDLLDIWDGLPVMVKDILTFGFGVPDHAAAREAARAYTLRGALGRMRCPLLIVHSGLDLVCPVAESERMKAEAGGPATLAIFPEGHHVCDNIPYKARPLTADWLAEQLRAG